MGSKVVDKQALLENLSIALAKKLPPKLFRAVNASTNGGLGIDISGVSLTPWFIGGIEPSTAWNLAVEIAANKKQTPVMVQWVDGGWIFVVPGYVANIDANPSSHQAHFYSNSVALGMRMFALVLVDYLESRDAA